MTGGYDLPARNVIHTVGPVWHGGASGEAELLASCYRNAMALADQHGLVSIAFPAISTGIYGYPIESAARIAVDEVSAAMNASQQIEKVIFCCFSDKDLTIYRQLLGEITES